MAQQIQLRRDSAANWTALNPTLAQGELGYEIGVPGRVKIGDGASAWSDLAYLIGDEAAGGLTLVEVTAAMLQPTNGRQYIVSNDLALTAPSTPGSSVLWETRIYLREGATLAYPDGWRVSGSPSATGANQVTLSYLDGHWCLEWRAAFEMASGTRLYVSEDGDDSNDGYSWAQALRSPAAALTLAAAGAATEIWIATGTYNAGTLNGFEIPSGVTVYGGFLGTEQTLAERSYEAPEDSIGANSYANATTLTNTRSVLSTAAQAVTGKQVYGSAVPTVSGCRIADSFVGACTDLADSLQLVDCTITGNQHVGSNSFSGGGTINVRLQGCTVTDNTCDGYGGGMYGGTATNCLFTLNASGVSSGGGGGAASGSLYSCRMTQNAAYDGGGAHSCTCYSCLADGNTVTRYGGGYYSCTTYSCESIKNNIGSQAETYGGTSYWLLVFGMGTSTSYGLATGTHRSCIVANCSQATGNITGVNNTYLHLDTANASLTTAGTHRNNLAFGCGTMTWLGTASNNVYGVLTDFVSPLDLPDGLVGAANEDALLAAIRAHGYDLAAGATPIGQGSNTYATAETLDYQGRPRIVATVDCGAYEFQG